MKLLEYKAHEIFRKYKIPCTEGFTVSSVADLDNIDGKVKFPAVIKAQVQTGGRGKAGGIKFAEDTNELIKKCKTVLGMFIKGIPVNTVYIVPKAEIDKEMYLCFTLDRKSKLPVMIFSTEGGVDINEIAEKNPDKVVKIEIPPGDTIDDFIIQYAIDRTGLEKRYEVQFIQICKNLFKIFIEYDCLLSEINPLASDKHGNLSALDGKMDIDDNSLYKHPDIKEFRDKVTENPLILEARKYDFLYIPIQNKGNIAVISNGSGMIMSSIDLITKKKMDVACALDLGGGATADRIKEAIRITASNHLVDNVFLNIFGGITRCDEIAGGVEKSLDLISGKHLVIRLEGTNKEKGLKILSELEYDIEIVDGLYQGVDALAAGILT